MTHVYLITTTPEMMKIGMSGRLPQRRLALQSQFPGHCLEIVVTLAFENRYSAYCYETAWHERLRNYKIKGEWFNAHPRIIAKVAHMIELGIKPRMKRMAPPPFPNALGSTEFWHRRKKLRLTREEFGLRVGASKATVMRWETGESRIPETIALALRELEAQRLERYHQVKGIPLTPEAYRAARELIGTQVEVAELLETTQALVSERERGNAQIRRENAMAMAYLLDSRFGDLGGRSTTRQGDVGERQPRTPCVTER
jgi:DNA-binding transcriptional regulator YiaG